MAKKQPFALIYDPDAIGHLDAIELKYHSLIRRTVEEQLAFEPDIETRNRKPLERPLILGARWEIRFGPDNRFGFSTEWIRSLGRFAFWESA
jgi:hypothetical protein